jgi:hypothetical protein
MNGQDLQDRLRYDRDDGSVGHEPSPLDDTTPLTPIDAQALTRPVRARRWMAASLIGPIADTRVASWLSARVGRLREPRQWTWVAAGVSGLALFVVLLVTLSGQGHRSRASSSTSSTVAAPWTVAAPPPDKAVPDRPVPTTAARAHAGLGPTAPRPVAPRAAEAAGSSAPRSTQSCSSAESGSMAGATRVHHGHHDEIPCSSRAVSGAQGGER